MSDSVVSVKSTATSKLLYLIKAKVTSIQAWSYERRCAYFRFSSVIRFDIYVKIVKNKKIYIKNS